MSSELSQYQYSKNLFNECHFSKYTSKILVPKEGFWDMVMKPISDIATNYFPVDYQTYPEGTKNIINQIMWKMRKTTREAFLSIKDFRRRHTLNGRTDNEKAGKVVMILVENALSPLKLDSRFIHSVRKMLVHLFNTDIDEPLAKLNEFLTCDLVNKLLVEEDDPAYKFDLLSTYFLRFVIQFVGDTTRLLFHRVDQSSWRFSESEYERLYDLFQYNRLHIEREEHDILEDDGRSVEEPVKKKIKIIPEKETAEQEQLRYFKDLYYSCRIPENTSNILEREDSFWKKSMEPEMDVAAEYFPVDFDVFPEGTKQKLNQLLWNLRNTTREAFPRMKKRGGKSRKIVAQEVAGVVLLVVKDAFSPLMLTAKTKTRLRSMLCRLFGTDTSTPLATFDDFAYLLKNLPSTWYGPMNGLLMGEDNAAYKFDVISTYFLRFVIQFVGDTTRIMFRRIDKVKWRFSQSEYAKLNEIVCTRQEMTTEEEGRMVVYESIDEPTEISMEIDPEAEIEIIEQATKKDERPILGNKHKPTLEKSRHDLLNNFPQSLLSLKNVISQLLFDETISDEYKTALIVVVSNTSLLESKLAKEKEKSNIFKSEILNG